jgi:hypothetical protein
MQKLRLEDGAPGELTVSSNCEAKLPNREIFHKAFFFPLSRFPSSAKSPPSIAQAAAISTNGG